MNEYKRVSLNLETLVNMTAYQSNIRQNVVTETARCLLLAHLKLQPSVHEIFFPDAQRLCAERQMDCLPYDFDSFASLLVCEAIVKGRDK